MGKTRWATIVVLCALSAGSILADDGRPRATAAEEIPVKEHVTGTISRIDGKRLRIAENPDPMGCATSGIKMVDIVEHTPNCFAAMLRLATTTSNSETTSRSMRLTAGRLWKRLKFGFRI